MLAKLRANLVKVLDIVHVGRLAQGGHPLVALFGRLGIECAPLLLGLRAAVRDDDIESES